MASILIWETFWSTASKPKTENIHWQWSLSLAAWMPKRQGSLRLFCLCLIGEAESPNGAGPAWTDVSRWTPSLWGSDFLSHRHGQQCRTKNLHLHVARLCKMKIRSAASQLARIRAPLLLNLRTAHYVQRRCFSRSLNFNQPTTDDRLRFPGALEAKFTTTLEFENPKDKEVIPCYRVMDSEGVIVDKSYKRDFTDEEAIKLYTNMVGVSIMDMISLDAQRQGLWLVLYLSWPC